MGNVLVFAEHLHGKFPKTTLVGVRGRQGRSRRKIGGKCHRASSLGTGRRRARQRSCVRTA